MVTRAYLDHASTTPLRPGVLEAMLPWMSAADPGRVHTEGRMARVALEDAREAVARFFGTRPRQVVFTSGATEAINAATFGALSAQPGAVLVPAVEHSAVRDASARYATSIRTVGADRSGRVSSEEVAAALAEGPTSLVHCQLANHEVGTLQPVREVADACRDRSVLLHVDAAAAAGHVEVGFEELGADMLSVSAHKLGGPKGIGCLLLRRGLRLAPFVLGGAQERARRGGLENLAAAVGFAAAVAELGGGALRDEASRAEALLGRLRSAAAGIADVTIYGPAYPAGRLPHLLCMGVGGVEAEPVLIGLDQAGVAAHSGSSCSSEVLEPSPVLEAMGVDAEHSLRFSVGWSSTAEEIDLAAGALRSVVGRLRGLRAGA